jgi:FkbM family methyltransferase
MRPTATIFFEGRQYNLHGWARNELIFRALRKTGAFYEERTLRLIRACGATGVYIDVGCNIGNHSVFFAKECGASFVLCFDAIKSLCQIARQNLAENAPDKRWSVCHAAVSDGYDKTIRFNESDDINKGRSRIDPAGTLEVPNIRLDTFLQRHPVGSVGLIKIDVEGAEVAVVQGALETIRRYAPVIVSECSIGKTEVPNREMLEINALLEPLGYDVPHPAYRGDTPVYIWKPLP